MAKRNRELEDVISAFIVIFIIGVFGVATKYQKEIKFYGYVFLAIALSLLIFTLVLFFIRKRKRNFAFVDRYNDDETLAMFRGLEPEQFERKVVEIFSDLGYKAEHVGRPYDGGIDVEARKDGDLYIIQCKRYRNNSAVGVKDLRELNGVVNGHLAKRGFIITSNIFTPAAEEESRQYPRIELVDKFKLLEYYKASKKLNKKNENFPVEKCPECGGNLVERASKFGRFLGCSNYPKCKFKKNIM